MSRALWRRSLPAILLATVLVGASGTRAAAATCAAAAGETVHGTTPDVVVLDEFQGDAYTATVCIRASGRRIEVDNEELLGGSTAPSPEPAIALLRYSGQAVAFVLKYHDGASNDQIVEINASTGRFQKFDSDTCDSCVPAEGLPAIPVLAVGRSGAVAWVVDDREAPFPESRTKRYSGGFSLFLRVGRRTRTIDHDARSITDLNVSKEAVTWRDAGHARRLRLA